jgi:RAT1-interacting protein
MAAESEWENVEDFLARCCEHSEIDMDYVRSDSFYSLLQKCDWQKQPLYEALYYSRTPSLEIELDRSLAKTWIIDENLFLENKDSNSWRMRRFPIDLGYGHRRFQDIRLKVMLLEEKARSGTKYVALANSERKGVKVQADIVATRSTLVDLMQAGIKKCKVLAWVAAVNDQLFLEKDRRRGYMDRAVMTGPNFEQLMTSRQKMVDGKVRFEWAKNNYEKYNSLVRHSSLMNDSILVSCEIDGVRPQKIDAKDLKEFLGLDDPVKNLDRYVEFKTRVHHRSDLKYFYAAIIQCYLAGTPTLVVGIKNELQLTSIKEWDVNEVLHGGIKRLEKWFLDRWLIFLVRFIKCSILKKRTDRLQSFSIEVQDSKLVLRECERSRLQIEAALTSDFVKWREEHPQNASADELADLLGPLSIQEKETNTGEDQPS